MQPTKSFKEKIQEIKESLETWQNIHKTQRSLLEERDLIEKEWILLKEDVEKKTLVKHQLHSYHPEKAQNIEKELAQDQEKLETLRKKLHALDQLLEEGGEDAEERIEHLMNSLVETIVHSHPEAKQTYQNFQSQLHSLFEKHKGVERVKMGLEPIYQLFQEGADTLEAAKKRKILDYFFGRHPKVIVSQKIHQAMKEGEAFIPHLKSIKKNATGELQEIYSELIELQETFISDAAQPWNQRLYTDKFLHYHQQFKAHYSNLNKILSMTEEQIFVLETQIEKWLESH